ncbi:MAG TPA: LPS assembly protein LptD [Myxococcota bacterium]|nr:LPS assembly protein LptD [Myxococcota bacterium]
MRRLGALLIVSALVLAAAARAQEGEPQPTKPPPPTEPSPESQLPPVQFTLTAKVVTYDSERDLYEATGDVKIVQADGRILTADWVLFNGTTRTGVASGDVVIVDSQNSVRAQFMAVDMKSTVSVAVNASMDSPEPGVQVRGDTISRTGVDTYEIERGNFTTCRCPPDETHRPWEIEAKDADVEIPGYATARDAWFKAFGVPLLYAPYLVYPVKTERQTGFLVPDFAQTRRNGTEIFMPFFWAVRDNVNVMLTPEWVSRRGFMTTTITDYVFEDRGIGHGGAAFLPSDREVATSDTEIFSSNRWAYWLRHQQPIQPGLEFGTDINVISDNNFVFDFPLLLGTDMQHQRMLESAGWLTAAGNGLWGNAVVSVFNDLQSPNDLDRDGSFLQRVPDLRGGTLQRQVFGLPLFGSFAARFTNFMQFAGGATKFGKSPVNGQFFDFGADARPDVGEPTANGQFPTTHPLPDSNRDDFGNPEATTTTEGDGKFEEGEPLADAGQRLDFYPKISIPLQFGFVDALTEGGMRETLYFPDRENFASRTIFTGRFDLRAPFGRSFALGTLPLSHVIEPRIAYAAVFAPSDQDSKPLFIPEPARLEPRLIDSDIRLVTEDPSDRVPDAQLLQLQISNRLYGPGRNESESSRLYGDLRIGSGYDWKQRGFTRVFASAELNPSTDLSILLDGGWNPQDKHLEDLRMNVGWRWDGGDSIRVGYRYNRNPGTIFEGFLGRGDEFDAARTSAGKINQVNIAGYLVATSWLEFFADGFSSLENHGASGGRIGTIVMSTCKCWDLLMQLEKVSRTNDTRFSFQFRLTGLGDNGRHNGFERRRNEDRAIN